MFSKFDKFDAYFDSACEWCRDPITGIGRRNPGGLATYGWLILRDSKRVAWGYGEAGRGNRHTPLGRLANAELRGWKSQARRIGYSWLADQLGIDVKNCHIGKFNVEVCKKVVEVCSPYFKV